MLLMMMMVISMITKTIVTTQGAFSSFGIRDTCPLRTRTNGFAASKRRTNIRRSRFFGYPTLLVLLCFCPFARSWGFLDGVTLWVKNANKTLHSHSSSVLANPPSAGTHTFEIVKLTEIDFRLETLTRAAYVWRRMGKWKRINISRKTLQQPQRRRSKKHQPDHRHNDCKTTPQSAEQTASTGSQTGQIKFSSLLDGFLPLFGELFGTEVVIWGCVLPAFSHFFFRFSVRSR